MSGRGVTQALRRRHAPGLGDNFEIPRKYGILRSMTARKTRIVGLSGGIGSGKSTVARTLAALGAAESDLTATRTRSILVPFVDSRHAAVSDALGEVAEEARAQLGPDAEIEYALDLRYLGQSYELTIAVDDARDPAAALGDFHRLHQHQPTHADQGRHREQDGHLHHQVTGEEVCQVGLPAFAKDSLLGSLCEDPLQGDEDERQEE